MTFIVAVQLKDSIVVAVDNKYLTLENKELDHFEEHISSKLYTWHSGIITVMCAEKTGGFNLVN